MSHPFLESLREFRQLTRPRGPVRLSQFIGPEVPFDVVERRRQALTIVDGLGPDFDFSALEAGIAKSDLKIEDTALLAEVLSLGKQMEADRKSLVGRAFGFGGAVPARIAEVMTFGLFRPPRGGGGQLLGSKDKAIANVVGDLFAMGTLGIGTYKAFGYFTQMPRVAVLAEQLPARVRSIIFTGAAGGAAGAVVDVARPEGIPAEPSAIDVPARIARFVEPITGERLGLAIGGAITGGALDLVLSPLIRGVSLMRENRLINRDLPDALVAPIREALREAGIPIGDTATKAQLVRKLLATVGKIRQTESVAGILAANNARAQHIAQFIYEHPDKIWFRPNMPKTKVVDASGVPLRVYHGTIAQVRGELQPKPEPGADLFGGVGLFFAEDPKLANVFTGETSTLSAITRTQRKGGVKAPSVTPAYLDLRDPLDVTKPFDDRIIDSLIEVLKEEGVAFEVGNEAQVRNAFRTRYGTMEEYISETGSSSRSIGVAKAAKKAGYDGIIYSAGMEQRMFDLVGSGDPNSRVFVAFRGDQIKPAFTIKEDPIYLASLFINNPTGVSIAKGVFDPDAIVDAARILGVRMAAVRAGNNVLIARPSYNLPSIDVPESLVSRFKSAVKAENRGFRAEPIMSILPNGARIVGKFDAESFARSSKITVPKGMTPEKAVREKMTIISAELGGGGSELILTLPSRVTNSQLVEVARFVDNSSVRRVVIMPSAAGETASVLDNPIGMQVQDRIASVLKLPDPKISDDVAKRMAQFVKTGVFEGQAGVLENGYAVSVLGRKSPTTLAVRDPFTQEISVVDESRIGLLSTSLDGVTTPNELIRARMNDAEKRLLAQAIKAANLGFDKPVRNSRQLERIAGARGLGVDKLSGGGYRVYDMVSGEASLYSDLEAASKGLKEMSGPMPDLTPPEMQAILGNSNVGMIGPPGPPPRFGERMSLPDDFDVPETFGRVPGAFRGLITPTRGLLLDIERIYNVPVGRTFLAVQEQLVQRDNFLAIWVDGALPGLPEGVQPLGKIIKRAGKGANQELITAWLEADDVARPAIVARMSDTEVAAARELNGWYDAMFERFGIEREYLTLYAPHIRRWADRYGNDVAELWRRTKGTPLPKGVEFIADYARNGTMDIYETRAFVAAGQYIHMGANNRFMKGVLEETRNVLWRIPDNAVKAPLVAYLEAIRGVEYRGMNAAIKASVDNMLESIGMTPTKTAGFTDRLSLTLLGLSYQATMAFRPGLAIRNMTQVMQTTWVMFGGTDDSLMEAFGRAMTLAGRDQAILDGAISIRTGGVYAAEEIAQAMPEPLRVMSEAGMKLYNGADMWTRSVSYWTGRVRAERAIAEYGRTSATGGREALQRAREKLIDDAGLFWFDKPVQDEFFRRLVSSPEKAAAWVGKNASDVTQYLYGRGNQVWWLRTVPGRFLGQYGTWPLWYMDFVRRSFMNAWRSGHHGQAMRFLGRLGIANAAIVGAGVAVGIDLGKWAGFSSLFFTGGPGAEALGGIATLQRGLGESLFDPDDPFAQSRLTEGSRILQRVGRAYIPMFYAARDLDRLMNPRTPHDVATAILAANPTRQYTLQEKLDLLMNLGRLSTDIEIETKKPGEMTAVELTERANRLRGGATQELRQFFTPSQPGQPGQGLGVPRGATAPPSQPGRPVPAPGEVRPIIR